MFCLYLRWEDLLSKGVHYLELGRINNNIIVKQKFEQSCVAGLDDLVTQFPLEVIICVDTLLEDILPLASRLPSN